ncbi:hypothetical protein BC939DRAFT_200735 [Gamsiella multidivaricata]|uniref:uncharacterized protein n=1 Tax=Gamsiella multidivaricata TaxID=101098 RepID=UPI00222016C8|nr:uncharacterized protein BC939DRAFT_200735 [Gamsiella multidivaricata]KAI7821954.1 hypothetical protein BC939DRAFT_200735 [Gamsiella multidivaricata]
MDSSREHTPENGPHAASGTINTGSPQEEHLDPQRSMPDGVLEITLNPLPPNTSRSILSPAQLQQLQQQQQNRRRRPPAWITGLPYPHQRTQSLSTSRPLRQQQSSVIRHVRNHTHSDALTPHSASSAVPDPTAIPSSSGTMSPSPVASPDQQLVTKLVSGFTLD